MIIKLKITIPRNCFKGRKHDKVNIIYTRISLEKAIHGLHFLYNNAGYYNVYYIFQRNILASSY